MSDGESASPLPLVLVVDDEAILRLLAADVLEENGFRVVEAEDAETTLKMLTGQPDVRVRFTDINLPGSLDGLDLAREVHARWPAIKLIATSGRLRPSNDEIPAAGRFAPKPYSPDSSSRRVGTRLSKPDQVVGSCTNLQQSPAHEPTP